MQIVHALSALGVLVYDLADPEYLRACEPGLVRRYI